MRQLTGRKHDPTAWELYQREHSDWNHGQQLFGFIALTCSMLVVIPGAVYFLQNIGTLILAGLFVLAVLGIKRFK